MKFKKPRFWDYKKPNFLSYILLPLTFPLIINNFFLRFKKKNVPYLKIKKICIGNIYVGGTGKTPLTMKIYQILNQIGYKTAIIKKFYKDHVDEQKILDENTKLYCLKDRALAVDEAIKDDNNVVIFDDGLQDRAINYDLKIVCFNNLKCVGNGLLIPAGPLREKIDSISKYDIAFINGNETDSSNMKLLLNKYNKDIKIFEANYIPTNIDQFDTAEKYITFSGIGNPETFRETLINNKFDIIKEIIFPDHHNYTQTDIDKIKLQAKILNAKIITTEKDYVKINPKKNNEFKFLKVEFKIKNEKELIDYLRLHI
ncbi:tetraacyldisaccharide 4'-kinase [Pelagibacteraceae bacterium]|nr:tetraacyldisaccharide 4'-kinase [Pelagibacteraceae bacterium]